MGQGSNGIINVLSILFLLLSLATCLCTGAILTDTVAVPDSLAPQTEVPLPTLDSVGGNSDAPVAIPTTTPEAGGAAEATAPPSN